MGDLAGHRRVFVAVPLPEPVLRFVAEAQGLLPPVDGVRLLAADQLHVTLAFLGEVDEDKVSVAREVVESVTGTPGGACDLGGFLFLPSPRAPRVVALAIADADGTLARLYEQIMSGLEAARVMQREKRPFRPHVTVARLRRPGRVQPMSEGAAARFAVESVCLYESELRRAGAQYTVLARAILA